MDELQAALLAIGFAAIVAVYGFGWWQQRQYRRKFGAAFRNAHPDVLYQDKNVRLADADPLPALTPDEGQPVFTGSPVPAQPANPPDDTCALLNAHTDFIIELHPAEPRPAALLDGVWQRKFDFGKPVQVCGWSLTAKKWERVIPDSQILYERFRIALQLVDRGGVISEAKLADFRDLVLGAVRHGKVDTAVPDIHETYRHALELDKFCAEVDQMVGINLLPSAGRLLSGGRVAQAVALRGMTLEADGAFHLLNGQAHTLFSVINQDSKPFQHHTLESFSTPGITLLLDVPRVENPGIQFDQMMNSAHELAKELQANLVDDHHVALSEKSLAVIRARIADVEAKMYDHGIPPGSAQARRLFS